MPTKKIPMKKYAFTVQLFGLTWDVYYFKKDDLPGTMAFAKRKDGKWVLGVFKKGELSEHEVLTALAENGE